MGVRSHCGGVGGRHACVVTSECECEELHGVKMEELQSLTCAVICFR